MKTAKNRNECHVTMILPEKSAAPDAANVAFLLSATPHTAPLWPSNVPTQSPVSPCRSIGLPSGKVQKNKKTIAIFEKKKWFIVRHCHKFNDGLSIVCCCFYYSLLVFNCGNKNLSHSHFDEQKQREREKERKRIDIYIPRYLSVHIRDRETFRVFGLVCAYLKAAVIVYGTKIYSTKEQ